LHLYAAGYEHFREGNCTLFDMVGLYKLNSVDPKLESARFQPSEPMQ
jgi:hypothetical protein